jgi:parvulin-like peptidyl-prolyl isomerase
LEQTIAAAKAVRGEIQAGRTTFADAARKHSIAPTGVEGGELGWIGRREPMPESFSRAAFALEKGGVSEPVATAFGVHLIQVIDIMPGDRKWQDVRGEVESEVTRYLFDWLAEKERAKSAIEFTRVLPHFLPGTRKLALAP